MQERSRRSTPDSLPSSIRSSAVFPKRERPTALARLWGMWAPILLASGLDLEPAHEEYKRWFTVLRRSGLSVPRIAQLRIDDIRVPRADREAFLKALVNK